MNVCECLRALRCTRVSRMEVEANIPPLQLRCNALLLCYGIKASGKGLFGNTTNKVIWQHHQLHNASAVQSQSDYTRSARKRA
ncbi:hypothetical protein E2C01_068227 [Portunus trituberculatus]|uniref:Uncharacterized protein n=1 Tax=Portunus trituberculatus TaxID=210409 RepID=A0A5B7HVY9_PORTR|nr:hypothetical protein [Portunus trituberculatus]